MKTINNEAPDLFSFYLSTNSLQKEKFKKKFCFCLTIERYRFNDGLKHIDMYFK